MSDAIDIKQVIREWADAFPPSRFTDEGYLMVTAEDLSQLCERILTPEASAERDGL